MGRGRSGNMQESSRTGVTAQESPSGKAEDERTKPGCLKHIWCSQPREGEILAGSALHEQLG